MFAIMHHPFHRGSETSSSSIFDTIGFWCLVALIFIGPIFFVPTISIPFQFTKTFLVAFLTLLALLFFVIGRLKEQRVDIPVHPLFFSVWLLPLAYGVATIFSGSGEFFGERIGQDAAGFILLSTVLCVLAALLFKTKERILTGYLAFLASAAVLSVFIIVRLVFGNSILSFGGLFPTNAATPLGTLYDSGIFFGLIAVLTLVSLSTIRPQGWVRVLLAVELVVSVAFLMLVNVPVIWSIVALCALGVFVGGLLPQWTRQKHLLSVGQSSGRNIGFSVASLFVLAVMLALFISGGSITNMLATSLDVSHVEVRPSWQTTIAIAHQVYNTSPVFGSGPGTFSQDWSLYRPLELNNTIFWNSDFETGIGFIPTSFITTGAVGAVAWIIFLALFLMTGFRTLIIRSHEDEIVSFLSLSSFLSALYLWIVAIFQTPTPILLSLAFLVTGISIASLMFRNNAPRQFSVIFADNPNFGFIAALMLTLCFLAGISGIFAVGQRYAAGILYQKGAIALQQNNDINTAEAYVDRALTLYEADTYLRFSTDLSLLRLNDLIAAQDISNEDRQSRFQAILTQAITRAQAATEHEPQEYKNWMERGAVYARVVPLGIQGAYENAVEAYNTAARLRPQSPSITLAYAYLERARDNNDAAEKYTDEAVRLRPSYTEAMFLMAQIQLQKGDVPKAIQAVQAASLLDPNNPVTLFQLGLLNYSIGRYGEALAALRQAVNLNTQYANARYFLGLTSWRLGNKEEAINQFVEIQKTNPDNTEVKMILQNLRAGQPPLPNIPPAPAEEVKDRSGPPIQGE